MFDKQKRSKQPNTLHALDSSSPVPGSRDVLDIDQTATSSDQQRVYTTSIPFLPTRKRGRPSKTAAAAAQPAATNISKPAECGLDALRDAIGSDVGAPSEDEEEVQRKYRAWDAQERKDHAERFEYWTKASKAKQYAPTIEAYLAWCAENKLKPEVVALGNIYKLGCFYNEYCSGKWLPPSKGRNRKGEGVQGTAAKEVHSALVMYVEDCCIGAGVAPFNPADDAGYRTYFKQYTADLGRAQIDVASQFTKEEHLKVCKAGYSSGDCMKMMLISLATAVVRKGDDLRELKLRRFHVTKIDSIGPASCYAIQCGLGGRKLNNGQPDQKAFIRNRVPEACPMGWMGQLFHRRFKLDKERLPRPGSAELDGVYLFPGKNANTSISYSQHKPYFDELMAVKDIATDKTSHVTRIHAAMLLMMMGVCLEANQHSGGWKQDCLGTSHIVLVQNPQALMALAMWRTDDVDLQCFWDLRMRIAVPQELINHAWPGLQEFTQQIEHAIVAAAAGDKAAAKIVRHRHMARVFNAVITIAIQDAIELADVYPDNPLIADMKQHPLFRQYVEAFKTFKALHGFDAERPVPLREQLSKVTKHVHQVLHMQQQHFSSSMAGVNLLHTGAPNGRCDHGAAATHEALGGVADGGDDDDGQPQEQALDLQQQQKQQQAQSAGVPTTSHTPGGSCHAAEDLLGKHTPQGWHLGGGCQPDRQQQQLFCQPPAQQLSFQQQQYGAEAYQSRLQPEQHRGQQQMSTTVQILQQQIQLQQADLAAMNPGPQRSEMAAQVQHMLQQLLKLQQAQVLQPGQQLSAQVGAAAAATQQHADISSMMGLDPVDAFMEPGVNGDSAFRAALGSRLSSSQSSSCSAAAAAGVLGYCTHVLQDTLQEMLPQALQQALQQAGFAASTTGAVTGVGSAANAAPKCAAIAAAAKSTSRGGPSQQAAKERPLQREVPFLKDQKSLPDMIKWYTQERDIPVDEGGKVEMYTRSELRDQGKSWVSRESSKRAAEYDVIYDRLKAVVVQLTKETDQQKTMDDAVQHVVQTAKVCQTGGITMYKYMKQCRAWRKAQKQAEAAAAAVAAAAKQEDGDMKWKSSQQSRTADNCPR